MTTVHITCTCRLRRDPQGHRPAPDMRVCTLCGIAWCARCRPTPEDRCPYVDEHDDGEHPPAHLTIPSHVLEQWTGRTFTNDETARLLAALTDSSVPDAVGTVAHAIFGTPLEWTDDPDGEPGDLTAESQRVQGDNTTAHYTLIAVNNDPDTHPLWSLHHTQLYAGAVTARTYLGTHNSLTRAQIRAQLFEAS